MPIKTTKRKQWIVTMSRQGRITIPKAIRERTRQVQYWDIRSAKKGFIAVPMKG